MSAVDKLDYMKLEFIKIWKQRCLREPFPEHFIIF